MFPVVGAAAAVAGLWALPAVGVVEKMAATGVGAALGISIGQSVWRQLRNRIYAGNRVTLYYTDTFVYALVLMAGLASLTPRAAFQGAGLLVSHPSTLVVIALGLASLGLAASAVNLWHIRRYELQHGPLRAKLIYTQSTTGAEGMLGRHAVVQAACAPEGTVRVRSELWRARSLDDTSLQVGEAVVVREVDGLCLLVERVKSGAA
jgi:membrane protein implicated in regulation of membrane protease activity